MEICDRHVLLLFLLYVHRTLTIDILANGDGFHRRSIHGHFGFRLTRVWGVRAVLNARVE